MVENANKLTAEHFTTRFAQANVVTKALSKNYKKRLKLNVKRLQLKSTETHGLKTKSF